MTRNRLLFMVSGVIVLAASTLALIGGWGRGGPESARAADPSNLQYGYVDQDSGMFVSIQLSTLHADAGGGWPANWQGNLDAFVIAIGEEVQAFDFEP